MNVRIALLLDREHQIGQTFLLDVDTIEELSSAMRNRIFPLLQLYFFDDWAKIRAVLSNNAYVTVKTVQALGTESDAIEEEREVFDRLPGDDPRWQDVDQYRKIYEQDGPSESDVS